MKLISENLHIISKNTKEAVKNRDESYIKRLLERQISAKPDWIDLNIGPARGAFAGTMEWLVNIACEMTEIPLSLDTTNLGEIEAGLKLAKNPEKWIINSTSADSERLSQTAELAKSYDTGLIALTMNSEIGIPKEADGRLELAFEIVEKTQEIGIENGKIFFDPLILPVTVEQSQALEALNTLRMLKESFDPVVLTTIGLSNVSNGAPAVLRPLINRVFFVLAAGCGLDSAIVDSFDDELIRINKPCVFYAICYHMSVTRNKKSNIYHIFIQIVNFVLICIIQHLHKTIKTRSLDYITILGFYSTSNDFSDGQSTI